MQRQTAGEAVADLPAAHEDPAQRIAEELGHRRELLVGNRVAHVPREAGEAVGVLREERIA